MSVNTGETVFHMAFIQNASLMPKIRDNSVLYRMVGNRNFVFFFLYGDLRPLTSL